VTDEPNEAFDEERELCDDGGCLGVKVDGRCNVCGLGGSGAAPRHASAPGAATDSDEAAFSEDEERQLCPDGACTGLIGSDGNCKECGRPAAS
jgi:hypothetical protein